MKAKWLKVDKLRRYDIYAPVTKSDKKYDFADAVKMTMEAFRSFDPKLEEHSMRVLEKNHLHSEVKKGKMGGAFAYAADPALTPWVLMNYNGTANDIMSWFNPQGPATIMYNAPRVKNTPVFCIDGRYEKCSQHSRNRVLDNR